MEQIDLSEAIFLQATAVTIASARGRHLADIIKATDGTLSATLPIGYRHPTEDRPARPEELGLIQAELRLVPDRGLHATGNLPEQFSGQLLRWAAKLIDMATRVDAIKPQEFKLAPLCYVASDVESGKTIKESCMYSVAEHAGEGHLRETGRSYKITSAPVEEFPKALAEFRTLCDDTGQADVYHDETAEELTSFK